MQSIKLKSIIICYCDIVMTYLTTNGSQKDDYKIPKHYFDFVCCYYFEEYFNE